MKHLILRTMISFFDRRVILSAGLVVTGLSSVTAANIWDGGGGNGNWSTAANWDNNTVPINSQTLTFSGNLQLSSINDVGVINAVTGLIFTSDAGAFTLSGNALTLGGNIINNSANTQTVGMNLAIANIRTIEGGSGVNLTGTFTNSGADRTLINNLTGGLLNMGNINLSNDATSRALTIVSNGTTVVNGVMANGGGSSASAFTKAGTGELIFKSANTYAGQTRVTGGKLTLDFSSGSAPISNILYNGVSAGSLTINQATANLGGSTEISLIGADNVNNTQAFNSMVIGASGADQGTSANLNLQAGVSGSLGITISGASNPLNMYRGATLNITKGASDIVTITNGINSNGVLSGGSNVGVSTLVTLNKTDWAALDGSKNVVAATYSNSLSTNNANVDVTSSGTVTATALNTLRFNQGTANALSIATANTTINGILVTSGMGNADATIAGQTIRGTNNQALAVFQNNTGGDLIIDAVIVNQGTSSGLVKAGAGRLVLNAANTYTGRTFVNEGTVLVNQSISTGAVTVGRDARLGGSGTIGGATTVTGGGVVLGGDGENATGSLTFSSDLNFLDGGIIELTLGSSGTHSSLVRAGGTWAFDSDQAFRFVIQSAATGVYDNIISGLTGSETGLASIGTWAILNDGMQGIFSYDGSGGVDLTVSVIPEPSAFALIAVFAVAWFFRRRNFISAQ